MKYLLINKETNIAEQSVAWDGNVSTWSPTATHLALPVASTPTIGWVWNEGNQEWEPQETTGGGGIGFVWNGSQLVKSKPTEPPVSEPVSES